MGGRIVITSAGQLARAFAGGGKFFMTCVNATGVANLTLSSQGTTNGYNIGSLCFQRVGSVAQAKAHYKEYPRGNFVLIKADSSIGKSMVPKPNGDWHYTGDIPPDVDQYVGIVDDLNFFSEGLPIDVDGTKGTLAFPKRFSEATQLPWKKIQAFLRDPYESK